MTDKGLGPANGETVPAWTGWPNWGSSTPFKGRRASESEGLQTAAAAGELTLGQANLASTKYNSGGTKGGFQGVPVQGYPNEKVREGAGVAHQRKVGKENGKHTEPRAESLDFPEAVPAYLKFAACCPTVSPLHQGKRYFMLIIRYLTIPTGC